MPQVSAAFLFLELDVFYSFEHFTELLAYALSFFLFSSHVRIFHTNEFCYIETGYNPS